MVGHSRLSYALPARQVCAGFPFVPCMWIVFLTGLLTAIPTARQQPIPISNQVKINPQSLFAEHSLTYSTFRKLGLNLKYKQWSLPQL